MPFGSLLAELIDRPTPVDFHNFCYWTNTHVRIPAQISSKWHNRYKDLGVLVIWLHILLDLCLWPPEVNSQPPRLHFRLVLTSTHSILLCHFGRLIMCMEIYVRLLDFKWSVRTNANPFLCRWPPPAVGRRQDYLIEYHPGARPGPYFQLFMVETSLIMRSQK